MPYFDCVCRRVPDKASGSADKLTTKKQGLRFDAGRQLDISCCSEQVVVCGGGNMRMAASALHTVLGRRAGVLRLLLELVFGLLPPGEMKNVVLVCRLWREVHIGPGGGSFLF